MTLAVMERGGPILQSAHTGLYRVGNRITPVFILTNKTHDPTDSDGQTAVKELHTALQDAGSLGSESERKTDDTMKITKPRER